MLVDHHEAGHLGAVRLARKPGADVLVAQLADDVLFGGLGGDQCRGGTGNRPPARLRVLGAPRAVR